MKQLLQLIIVITLFVSFTQVQAVETSQLMIKQSESHSVFKGVFLEVWSKLRSMNPQQRDEARAKVIYTAGTRGQEATETLLKPYWKGDLSTDENFQNQLKQFIEAQQYLDHGDLQASAQAFEAFIRQNEMSDLLSNALFAKSICYAGLGDKERAMTAMQQFLDDYPKHPLVADARQVIEQLK